MDAPVKGYSMPFSTDKRRRILLFVCLAALAAAWILVYDLKAVQDSFSPQERHILALFCIVLFIPCFLPFLPQCFGRVHFVPEGIAITLWGMTLRRFPAERIRFISGVPHNKNKLDSVDLMALCDYSLEELTELKKKRTPRLFRNGQEFWPGEWAGRHLAGQVSSGRAFFQLHRRILWLEWDPERLEALLQLYPHARWLDCTKDKYFDQQLSRR